jgi:hypothetical protein
MAALYANTAGLTGAASQLALAASALAGVAATLPAHPPLAMDEVSVSAAVRLSECGAVMASRAADGAQVLRSAAAAVLEVTRALGEMDRDNASTVSLRGGGTGGVGTAMTGAITADLPTPDVPISASAVRDGEVSAAIMEAGRPEAGASFDAGCQAHGAAFRTCAAAARSGQAAVDESLHGHTAPRLSAALGRFAAWADAMTTHADTVRAAAAGHRQRFDTAKRDTPRTQQFGNKRRELANAQILNARYGGAYSGVVASLQGELASLHSQAGFAASNYHLGELPDAPAPPPPVAPVVNPADRRPGQDVRPPGSEVGLQPGGKRATGSAQDGGTTAGADDALAGIGGDVGLGDGTESDTAAIGDPQGSGLLSEAAPMAAMLPSLLVGVVGAAASFPAQIGQQAQSLASEAGQAVQGLTTGLAEPDAGDFDASVDSSGDSFAGVGGVGGGVGGGTDPAAGPVPLAPSGGGMLAMGAPAATSPPLVGAAPPSQGPAPAAAAGGMPMFMPPMAGMGGQGLGARPAKDPDKSIHVPTEAHSEMVKGEVARRSTAVADDPTGEKKRMPTPAVSVATSRRRIELSKDDG